MTLSVGELVDERYRVLRPIGEGGMGCVYLAENVRIARRVALKVLHPHLASLNEIVVRFEREAKAAARIGSPHVADVIDLGFLPTGDRFVIMEYLEGESLATRLTRVGRLTPNEMVPITMQLLDGLAEVHAAGIVHRDLKPGNVFLSAGKDGDFVKILDFGVSKFHEGLFTGPDALTTPQDTLGTPSYMSPEQARGELVDQRADVYSVGAVLYRSITGILPFNPDNYLKLLLAIARDEPRPVEELAPGIDPRFAAVVRKAMSKDPAKRYQSAAELRDAIAAWTGRIDRILAEFLGLHHAASTIARHPSTPRTPPAASPPPLPRGPIVSKVVIDKEEQLASRALEPATLTRKNRDEQLDEQVDALIDAWTGVTR